MVDSQGTAIITDFGLSKVVEELTDGSVNPATSFFAGSTRWMAPELLLSLVEDEGHTPPITTFSDVYSFASVCLEVSGFPFDFNTEIIICARLPQDRFPIRIVVMIML